MKELDVVITENTEACGGVIYWTLCGGVSLIALAQTWAAEGLHHSLLPKPTQPEKALRVAMLELQDRQHIVRRLPDGTGYALVAEHGVDEKRADYKQTLRVFLDAEQEIIIEPSSHPDAEKVLDAYDLALGSLSANDISSLLIATCKRLRAVSLRPMGGVYFVPQPVMGELEQVVRALEGCSPNRVWRLPAMRSSDAARAVLAAITEEAEHEAEKMEHDLEVADGELGARAIATREERTKALRAKVAEYELLMGGSLESVRTRLERVQAALSMAALSAAAADEAA